MYLNELQSERGHIETRNIINIGAVIGYYFETQNQLD
jgi:hypothetical protein